MLVQHAGTFQSPQGMGWVGNGGLVMGGWFGVLCVYGVGVRVPMSDSCEPCLIITMRFRMPSTPKIILV
jgi:hypothetical protein